MLRPKHTGNINPLIILYGILVFLLCISVSLIFQIDYAESKEAKTVCFSPDFVKRTTKAKKIAPIVFERKGGEAKDFIDDLNKAGKPTSYVGDLVVFWAAPYLPPLQAVIFNKGCAVVICRYNEGCQAVPKNIGRKKNGIKT